jgi:hypothetical protein
MSWAEPEEGEPWISREEIVEREFEAKRREYEELQRLIDERCREAGKRWRASHPWLEPGWCVSVPVRLLCLP